MKIETPKLVKTETLTTAKIYQVIPASQIRQAMGQTVTELRSAIRKQGKTITGPWFVHHMKPPAENFDFEVCFPVSHPIEPMGRVQPGEWPEMNLIRTFYRGGYEGLPAAWAEFTKWVAAHKHAVTADIWERYISGPETGTDSSAWVTELNCPMAD
jgi:effector-binding domain-containing protein